MQVQDTHARKMRSWSNFKRVLTRTPVTKTVVWNHMQDVTPSSGRRDKETKYHEHSRLSWWQASLPFWVSGRLLPSVDQPFVEPVPSRDFERKLPFHDRWCNVPWSQDVCGAGERRESRFGDWLWQMWEDCASGRTTSPVNFLPSRNNENRDVCTEG